AHAPKRSFPLGLSQARMLLASTFSEGRKIAFEGREGIHLLCFDGGVGLRQAGRQFHPLRGALPTCDAPQIYLNWARDRSRGCRTNCPPTPPRTDPNWPDSGPNIDGRAYPK